jgi:PPM family protein phosphatase
VKTKIAVHWQYGAATHSGWFRTTNEDRSLLRMGTTAAGMPYAAAALADGIGGVGDGRTASETAMLAVKQWLDERLPQLLEDKHPIERVESSLQGLFRAIHRLLLERGTETGTTLGTTLTVLFLMDETFLIAHVGDCRIYYIPWRGGLKRLTKDHSWVSEQMRRGRMTRSQARTHPKRHVLVQTLGVRVEPSVYIRRGMYTPRSVFLFSSDGFHDRFTDLKLSELLKSAREPDRDLQELADELLDKALDRQAEDNISIMLISPMTRTCTDRVRWTRRLMNVHRQVKKLLELIPVYLRK